MSKITVGMLVRIVDVRIKRGPNAGKIDWRYLGHVGRVLRPYPKRPGTWAVEGAEFTAIPGCVSAGRVWRSESLEPIYDGNRLVSWDECIWKPKGVAA